MDRYFRRKEASEFLRQLGIPVAAATLAKMACMKEGPPVHHFGRVCLYLESELLRWVKDRMSAAAMKN